MASYYVYWLTTALQLTAVPKVGVIALDAASAPAALEVRQALAAEPRFSSAGAPIAASPAFVASQALNIGRQKLSQARDAYDALRPNQALASLGEAQNVLMPWSDRVEVCSALAQSRRLLGLVHLYQGEPEAAAEAFASATFLAPQWSPERDTWPPEARLAYADAVASVQRAAGGSLSVSITPAAATFWLDGKAVGTGSTTLQSIAPGQHFLLAESAAYKRLAAIVEVRGRGHLSSATLYLKQLSAQDAFQAAVSLLGSADISADVEPLPGSAHSSPKVLQALDTVGAHLGADLVLIMKAAGQRVGNPLAKEPERGQVNLLNAVLWHRQGRFVGSLIGAANAASVVEQLFLSMDEVTYKGVTAPASQGADAPPAKGASTAATSPATDTTTGTASAANDLGSGLLSSPWTWAVAAGVGLLGASAIVWSQREAEPARVTLGIGRP